MRSINLLGYTVSHGVIKPDPDRLAPLITVPDPHDTKSLKRIIGMFSYYSNRIKKFSAKILPLTSTESFPLSESALNAFNMLKKNVEHSVLNTIDETIPFMVETDASDRAIAATLSQNGRPVASFSLTLNSSELMHYSIEKESYAIVEAIRKWRHYLATRNYLNISFNLYL